MIRATFKGDRLGLAVLAFVASAGGAHAEDACSRLGPVYSVLKLSVGNADTASAIIPTAVPIDDLGNVNVHACGGAALLAALKRGDNLDDLLAKRVVLVIVESGLHLEHYVVPYLKESRELHGVGLVPVFPLCGGEGRDAQCKKYLPQLQAVLTASIALEQLRKPGRDPCDQPARLLARVNDAHARLAPYLQDTAVRALDRSLTLNDNVLDRANAAKCGPSDINRGAAQTAVVSFR